jgi:hypothetical protein
MLFKSNQTRKAGVRMKNVKRGSCKTEVPMKKTNTQPEDALPVKRNQRDTVFRVIYKDKEKALSLYNGVNHSFYDNPELLEFNTLENAVYMNVKNDLSFLVANETNLYEHQSTLPTNIPLRDLFYISDILQKRYQGSSLYRSRRIMIPTPRFVVFYNGTETLPEKTELKLSDSFLSQTDQPSLELRVTVLNINPGMNEELKKRCPSLGEYVRYVEKVRHYAKEMSLAEAVNLAVDECIAENILRDFLRSQKAEVVKMSIYEFDEEREMQLIREDEREIGIEIGRQEGEKYGLQRINELNKRLKAAGRTDDLLKSIDNPEYQKALMKEYGI